MGGADDDASDSLMPSSVGSAVDVCPSSPEIYIVPSDYMAKLHVYWRSDGDDTAESERNGTDHPGE